MHKRLAAVVLALATRRLLWVWGTAYLALVIFGFLWSKQEGGMPAYPDARPISGQIVSRAELERLLAEGREAEVESLNCRYDWDNSSSLRMVGNMAEQQRGVVLEHLRRERGLPEFDRFPALRAVDLKNCIVFPEDAERLARCHSLEWLSLEGTTLVGCDASFLDRIERLETLVVRQDTDAAVLTSPRRLPNLRMLVVAYTPPQQQQALAAMRDSPRLHSVVVNGMKLSPESVEILKTLPSLSQVFVSGYAADPQGLKELRGQLPQVNVWHSEFAHGRLSAAMLLFLTTTCLGVGLAWLAQTTFSIPQTRLYPRYLAPHLGVLLGFGSFMIVVQAVAATRFGAQFLPAVAIETFAAGLLAAVATFNYLALTRRSGTQHGGRVAGTIASWIGTLPGLFLMFLILAGFELFRRHRYLIESYLLGELFSWNLVFLIAGLALLGVALARLPRLTVVLNESGITPGLTFDDMLRRQQQTRTLQMGWQRRLARLPKTPVPPTWLWQAHAMRVAGSHTFGNSLFMLIMMGAAFVGPQWLMGLSAGRKSGPPLVLVLLVLMGLQPGFVTAAWWQRRRAFPTHLLFPWSRQEFTRAAFRGFGCDVLATLIAPLFLIPAANVWLRWNLSPGLVVLGALAAVGVSALVSAWMLWVLTFRQGFLAILAAYFGAMLSIFVGTTPALLLATGPSEVGQSLPAILSAVAAVSALLATMLVVFAYRRWLRVEWGLIAAK